MIRVFLLDDHEVVRRGLADLLHAGGDIEVVGESGSAQEAARRIRSSTAVVAVGSSSDPPDATIRTPLTRSWPRICLSR